MVAKVVSAVWTEACRMWIKPFAKTCVTKEYHVRDWGRTRRFPTWNRPTESVPHAAVYAGTTLRTLRRLWLTHRRPSTQLGYIVRKQPRWYRDGDREPMLRSSRTQRRSARWWQGSWSWSRRTRQAPQEDVEMQETVQEVVPPKQKCGSNDVRRPGGGLEKLARGGGGVHGQPSSRPQETARQTQAMTTEHTITQEKMRELLWALTQSFESALAGVVCEFTSDPEVVRCDPDVILVSEALATHQHSEFPKPFLFKLTRALLRWRTEFCKSVNAWSSGRPCGSSSLGAVCLWVMEDRRMRSYRKTSRTILGEEKCKSAQSSFEHVVMCVFTRQRADDKGSWRKWKAKPSEFHRAGCLFSGVIEDVSRPMRVLRYEGRDFSRSSLEQASVSLGKLRWTFLGVAVNSKCLATGLLLRDVCVIECEAVLGAGVGGLEVSRCQRR